jgi:putative membrane protein
MTRKTYLLILGGLFVAWSVLLAIHPYDRSDWALENALVVVAVILIAATCRKAPLSRVSYTLIFLFLCLHEVGAHFTYAETPYDEWFRQWLGFSLNGLFGLERNHFDRLVHFLFGLMLAYPVRELFIRVTDTKGFWSYFLPLVFMIALSAIYELLEWAAALIFGGDLGIAFLGTQGDEWDAQKDMALAILGAAIAIAVMALVNTRLRRDFAREWNESLRRARGG